MTDFKVINRVLLSSNDNFYKPKSIKQITSDPLVSLMAEDFVAPNVG